MIVIRKGFTTQLCPVCDKLVEAYHETTWKDYQMIMDHSTCPFCEKVLWHHEWWANAPKFDYSKSRPKFGQLSLF